jgi:NAD(P)-dependent dehydrogenase (short-subunit alcohol dehydrogenase family)
VTRTRTSTTLTLAALGALGALLSRPKDSLEGKVVVITGGTRGLGLSLSREFQRRGARLAICARDPEEIRHAKDELSRNGEVFAARCDITDRAEAMAFIDEVAQTLGGIDVLVNNAGLIQVGPLESMTLEDFDEAMATHFFAPLHLIWATLPHLRERRGGRIVNVSSVGGKLPAPHLLPYVASKYALTGLSEGLRVELARANVKVTTVCPGLMRTGSPAAAWFKGQHKKEYAWFKIADSLPGVTISSERAARRIVDACVAGRAELILTPLASLAARFHGALPELSLAALTVANALLPGPGGIGTERRKGAQSETTASRIGGFPSDVAASALNEPH